MPDVTTPTRRGELLRIAAELFATKGFKNTTVRDIAEASGIPDTSRPGDPRFRDAPGGDYRPAPGSPAARDGAGARDLASIPAAPW